MNLSTNLVHLGNDQATVERSCPKSMFKSGKLRKQWLSRTQKNLAFAPKDQVWTHEFVRFLKGPSTKFPLFSGRKCDRK